MCRSTLASAIIEPSVADVLSCVLSDARSFADGGGSFGLWCGCLGLDEDSISAARAYKDCARVAPRVRLLLGPLYDEFLAADH